MTENERHKIFKEWLEKYRALMLKVIRAYASELEDQEDLFQEISIQVWHSIPGFEGRCAVTTWLYRIAINTALKWKTKAKKHAGSSSLDGHEHFLHATSEEDKRIGWLYRQIAQLSAVDRSLAILLLDGYSYREMSEILGITESNIGVKIHRIKKQLVAESKKYEYDGI